MKGFRALGVALVLASALASGTAAARPQASALTLAQALSYPFITGIVAAKHADRIAWTRMLEGVRNVWVADGPAFKPRQVTAWGADDGQEISWLTLSPDGSRLIFVRGGDHDANWKAKDDLAPDPDSMPEEPKVAIWSASLTGGAPVKIAEGDAPAISSRNVLAYIKDGQAWTAPLDAPGKAHRLFFDRGKVTELVWSPDGEALAFVSARGDHALIGVYTAPDRPIVYLAPSTNRDGSPRWSPDGRRIAFIRRPGLGGPPEPLLTQTPRPWSIWVARADDGGDAREVWASSMALDGSCPDVDGGTNLHWAAEGRLVFLSEQDNWPHLYSVPAAGGAPLLLTPGAFQVEHVSLTRDRRSLIFDANAGAAPGDDDRRHLYITPVDRADMRALTSGEGLEWKPADAGDGEAAFVAAGVGAPPSVAMVAFDGRGRHALTAPDTAFPASAFVTPRSVSWTAPDGTLIHGQLFQSAGGAAVKPGVIFVHGGPSRQMLLGWHSMNYYSNAYAVNQVLAAHGFVVLSVNYRLGIGYGYAFENPAHAGPAGASEYQDVLSGAKYLQSLPGVDPARIGIWGGSYGGYLTALGLARNSDVFKAGVDMHGVHDWTQDIAKYIHKPIDRYEQGDWDAFMKVAWESSPDADIARWRSPVLLIQGDDDRNVAFHQTVDLARRLDAHKIPYSELVIPNEIHGFLRHASWLRADAATVAFLAKALKPGPHTKGP